MAPTRLTILVLLVGCGSRRDADSDASVAADATTADANPPDAATDGVVLGGNRFADYFERAALGPYWTCNGSPCQVPAIVEDGVAVPTAPSSRWAWDRMDVASGAAIATTAPPPAVPAAWASGRSSTTGRTRGA